MQATRVLTHKDERASPLPALDANHKMLDHISIKPHKGGGGGGRDTHLHTGGSWKKGEAGRREN